MTFGSKQIPSVVLNLIFGMPVAIGEWMLHENICTCPLLTYIIIYSSLSFWFTLSLLMSLGVWVEILVSFQWVDLLHDWSYQLYIWSLNGLERCLNLSIVFWMQCLLIAAGSDQTGRLGVLTQTSSNRH